MNRKNKDLLAALLTEFFNDHDINGKGVLSNNEIAKLLKSNLSKKDRWKNLSRGKLIDANKYKDLLNKVNKDRKSVV